MSFVLAPITLNILQNKVLLKGVLFASKLLTIETFILSFCANICCVKPFASLVVFNTLINSCGVYTSLGIIDVSSSISLIARAFAVL